MDNSIYVICGQVEMLDMTQIQYLIVFDNLGLITFGQLILGNQFFRDISKESAMDAVFLMIDIDFKGHGGSSIHR